MKVRRMLAIDKVIFDRLSKVCDDNNFYKNSFITHTISNNLDKMNSYTIDEYDIIRQKRKKERFQIRLEEEIYNKIQGVKIHKIEAILDEVLKQYEQYEQ